MGAAHHPNRRLNVAQNVKRPPWVESGHEVAYGNWHGNGGWYGTKAEWARLEGPLLSIDATIRSFATAHDLKLSGNPKDWPERSLAWGSDPACLIQLYLADQGKLSWNLWIVSSQDRGCNRYWKREMLVADQPLEEFRERLPELLEQAFGTVQRWRQRPEDFEFAGPILCG